MIADFWSWSLAAYRREGVEAALLELQDRYDLSVNILLWCIWCAQDFAELPDIAIRKAADLSEQWTRAVTGPLRTARRALKTPPRQVDATAPQRFESRSRRSRSKPNASTKACWTRWRATFLRRSKIRTASIAARGAMWCDMLDWRRRGAGPASQCCRSMRCCRISAPMKTTARARRLDP